MTRIRLIHWKPEEAGEQIRSLLEAGFDVRSDLLAGPNFLRVIEDEKPDAVLIDLTRAPSQGRDLAVMLRMRKGTREIPLLFVGGKDEKVDAIRKLLPDADFVGWEGAVPALKAAIQKGIKDPVVPDSAFAGYAGKPLAGKLGINADFVVRTIGAPADFEATLGKLPRGASVVPGAAGEASLTIWFVLSAVQLSADLASITAVSKQSPVWIAWPKKGSAIQSDLTQQVIRKTAMAEGMVDYKICSIDKDWSALLFRWRGKGT